jgi:hypothetical protein
MPRSTPRRAIVTVVVCLLAAAGEVALLTSAVPLPEPVAAGLAFVAFLVGAPVFLAVLAWRRRDKPDRVKLLFVVSLVIGIGGLVLFTVRAFADDETLRHPALNPAVVPLGQWMVVLVAWFRVTAADAREKRRSR